MQRSECSFEKKGCPTLTDTYPHCNWYADTPSTPHSPGHSHSLSLVHRHLTSLPLVRRTLTVIVIGTLTLTLIVIDTQTLTLIVIGTLTLTLIVIGTLTLTLIVIGTLTMIVISTLEIFVRTAMVCDILSEQP